MNKTRIILASTGGVIAVGVLVAAYFLWSAFSKKTAAFEGNEESDGLVTVVGQVASLMNKKPYPDKANEKKLQANCQTFEDWYQGIRSVAAAGDWLADGDCSPAQFKEQIGRDAKALSNPAKRNPAAIVAPDFTFGPFKEYLADKMPARDGLARLQRQWYDITSLIELLATNGVIRLTDLQVVEVKAPAAEAESKTKSKAKSKAKVEAEETEPSVETYRLTFQAKPAALVGVIRTLSFQKRFTVVESFGFSRERDAIAEAFGVGEKKEIATASAGRQGRRRRGVVAEAVKTAEKKSNASLGGVVFDPETDSTLNVALTVSVYDFRTLEGDEKGASK